MFMHVSEIIGFVSSEIYESMCTYLQQYFEYLENNMKLYFIWRTCMARLVSDIYSDKINTDRLQEQSSNNDVQR